MKEKRKQIEILQTIKTMLNDPIVDDGEIEVYCDKKIKEIKDEI